MARQAPEWRRLFSWAGRATLTEIVKVFKVGHLDFSNLWCGEYPCSSGLTSLFERKCKGKYLIRLCYLMLWAALCSEVIQLPAISLTCILWQNEGLRRF